MAGLHQKISKRLRKRVGTLYACRPILNTDDITAWAKSQGLKTVIEPADMHVTIAFSKAPLEWPQPRKTYIATVAPPVKGRSVERLGDKGAVVLRFASPLLAKRWQELRDRGASWDFPEYKPHITLSYKVPEDFDVNKVEPYMGEIVLGPEKFSEVKSNIEHTEKARKVQKSLSFADALAPSTNVQKQFDCALVKANKDLGLIFGWAIVSTEDGEPYYDVQGDHIPEDSMLEASTDFMLNHRTMKVMHSGKKVGEVVFAWPMTEEVAEAMGISSDRTGLMIAVKPDSKSVIERFKDGKYTGFSIGGNRLVDEDVDD